MVSARNCGDADVPPVGKTAAVGTDGQRYCSLGYTTEEGQSGRASRLLSAHVVSGRVIEGSTCSSAGDRRYCFPHYIGGGGGQGACSCR